MLCSDVCNKQVVYTYNCVCICNVGEIIDDDIENKEQSTKYKLFGVVVHSGQASGGHYYSYILHRYGQNGSNTGSTYQSIQLLIHRLHTYVEHVMATVLEFKFYLDPYFIQLFGNNNFTDLFCSVEVRIISPNGTSLMMAMYPSAKWRMMR